MLRTIAILIALTLISCESKVDESILTKKYIEGFNQLKIKIEKNTRQRSGIDALIDTIIVETKTAAISNQLRKQILTEIELTPEMKFEPERLEELISLSQNFESGNTSLIEDLDFIDRFLKIIYIQNWVCRLGGFDSNRLTFALDTIKLQSNQKYEIPIGINTGYMGNICLLENSLQGESANTVKFETQDHSKEFQSMEIKYSTMNTFGEKITFGDKFVIELVE